MNVMNIDNSSSEPLYIQIQQVLFQEIRQGRYDGDGRLPSERELSERFNVSRMTARQALHELMKKGWAYTQAGKGTYVRRLSFRQELARLTSFSEDMRALGIEPSSRLLKAHETPASEEVADRLGIDPGSAVVELQRLRLANKQPVAIETAYLVSVLCPDILAQHDFSRESLYGVLERDYALTLGRAEQTIRARLATDEEARLLVAAADSNMKPTAMAVLQLSRVSYTPHDRPVEYVYSVYHAAFYEFHASLQGTRARIILPSVEEQG